MKKFYTLICAFIAISFTASAQYTGGTFTTSSAGLWHQTDQSLPGIWGTGAEPPSFCNNCLINLTAPGIVQLNTQVVLNGGSTLNIADGVTLQVLPSNGTSFTTAPAGNYIVLDNYQNNVIHLQTSNSVLDATNPALSDFDGVFTSFPNDNSGSNFTLVKAVGGIGGSYHLTFLNNTPQTLGNPQYGNSLTGGATLNGFGALPILLSSFTASLSSGSVDLAWTTTMEINADHIGIQRSNDAGAHWNTIGTEAARGSAGTATNYTYVDGKAPSGTSEYRLQLVDKDGKYTYSSVKTIRNGLITAVSVYPNPAHDYVNVTLAGSSTENIAVRFFNQNGQLLQEKVVTNGGGTTVALAVNTYPQGNYLIVVTGADGVSTSSKLMISK